MSGSVKYLNYLVTVRLSEQGARQLHLENGRRWMEGMDFDDTFEAENEQDVLEIAGAYGDVLWVRPLSPIAPATVSTDAIECDGAAIAETYARPMGVQQAEARRSHGSQIVLLADAEDRPTPNTPVRDALLLAAIWSVGLVAVTAVWLGQCARRLVRPLRRHRLFRGFSLQRALHRQK